MKYLMYQIVRSVRDLHSRGIVHRDIKPQNILVSEFGETFISDFGLATSIAQYSGKIPMDITMGTPCYKAPELLFCDPSQTYTTAVDIWALGCVLVELLRGEWPLFNGADEDDVGRQILGLVGFPSLRDIEEMSCDMTDCEHLNFGGYSTASTYEGLMGVLPHASVDALDFIRQCLQFNPNRRLTAEELLEHPFLCDAHDGATYDPKPLIDIPFPCTRLVTPDEYRDGICEALGLVGKSEIEIPGFFSSSVDGTGNESRYIPPPDSASSSYDEFEENSITHEITLEDLPLVKSEYLISEKNVPVVKPGESTTHSSDPNTEHRMTNHTHLRQDRRRIRRRYPRLSANKCLRQNNNHNRSSAKAVCIESRNDSVEIRIIF